MVSGHVCVRDGHSNLAVGSIMAGTSLLHKPQRAREGSYKFPRVEKRNEQYSRIFPEIPLFSGSSDRSGHKKLLRLEYKLV